MLPAPETDVATLRQLVKLTAGLAIVFLLFHFLATALGSDRGQAGLLVAAVVIGALMTVERVFFGRTPIAAMQSLGLGQSSARGILAALGVCVLLLATIPVYAALRGASLSMLPGWTWMLPGLFAQAGVAEEALFRGYLFGRLRRGRSFWHSALLSAGPFIAVHLILFATLPWPVALAADTGLPIMWMAASALVPWLVFIPSPRR